MMELILNMDIRIHIMMTMVLFIFFLYFLTIYYPKVKNIFVIVSISYNLVYLLWRTFFTLPVAFGVVSTLLGIILLLAEWMGFWQSLTLRILFWRPFQNKEHPPLDFDEAPAVDVFIATYNENLDILRKTVAGCLNLNYPHDKLQIYLCDDGRRKEAKQLCFDMGIHYITREDNSHAKAGNLNYALSMTDGEYIMVLDADMLPKSNFLEKTMGYFTNEKVGFVQTPQVFYNPDPFQFNLKFDDSIPNEQDFFMLEVQGGRANYNAVLHVGTNAVFRRKALEDIGGVPTGTITEDMATGMLIQAKGYESVFIKEVLCTGLSVETFSDLVKQRERWCRGNIQATKKWNPLTLHGLTPAQRYIYLDGFVYWFFGVQKMIYIMCPIIYLIFGTVILNVAVMELLLFLIPSYVASALTFRALVSESRTITWSHIYEVAMAPFMALAALYEVIFSRPIPFRVTPKGVNTGRTKISLHVALPHIVLFLLTILGWYITLTNLDFHSAAEINSGLINLAWSIYNGFAILLSIIVCVERPRKRIADRLVTDEHIWLSSFKHGNCRIVDISETGIKVECANTTEPLPEPKTEITLTFENQGCLTGEIVWAREEKSKKSIGIQFDLNSNEDYKKLIKYISDRNFGYYNGR